MRIVCWWGLAIVLASGCTSDTPEEMDAEVETDSGRDAGEDDAGEDDAGEDDAGEDDADVGDATVDVPVDTLCTSAAECQNGTFCDGHELCAPGTAGADARGCVAGTPPCAGACDEEATACLASECVCSTDAAGTVGCDDGMSCERRRCFEGVCRPGSVCATPPPEPPCDSSAACDDGLFCNGIRNCCGVTSLPPCGRLSCDERTDTCRCTSNDQCSDGLYCTGVDSCDLATGRCRAPIAVCTGPGQICLEGLDRCAGSCSDDSHCDDGRACNGTERCRGGVCGRPLTCSTDLDGDGAFSEETGGNDCDDGNPRRYPANDETCDAGDVDEDCDPTTFGVRDIDGDGAFDARCCNWNATGTARNCGTDCDDTRADVGPTAAERCNGIDDDCDGAIDELVTVQLYRDEDGDGSGDPSCASLGCAGTDGFVTTGNDCDDARASIRVGSTICAPDGTGVRVCEGGAWTARACPAGTTCRPQPDGTGLCL